MNQNPNKNSAPSASPRENPLPLDDITGAIVDAALLAELFEKDADFEKAASEAGGDSRGGAENAEEETY